MVKINISEREKELLINSTKNIVSTLDYKIEDSAVVIETNVVETLEEITEEYLLNYYLAEGLSNDDEPNALGLEIEKLQDKFIRELQKCNNDVN